jgi:hypothetical protein
MWPKLAQRAATRDKRTTSPCGLIDRTDARPVAALAQTIRRPARDHRAVRRLLAGSIPARNARGNPPLTASPVQVVIMKTITDRNDSRRYIKKNE